jgi:hypothetical protein
MTMLLFLKPSAVHRPNTAVRGTRHRTRSGATRAISMILGTLVTIAAVSACGSTGSTATAAHPPDSAGGTFPQSVAGNYTRTLTRTDLARTAANRHEPANQKPPTGRFQLTLLPAATLGIGNGTMEVHDPNNTPFQEHIQVSATGSFKAEQYLGTFAFCPHSGLGTYTWTLHGTKLTLTPTSDHCADRDAVLTGTWTRQ